MTKEEKAYLDIMLNDEDGNPVCCDCPCAECCEDAVMLDYAKRPVCLECNRNCGY